MPELSTSNERQARGAAADSAASAAAVQRYAQGVQIAAQALAQLGRAADYYNNLQTRIRLVTNSQREAADVQQRLFQLAQRTRADFGATVQTYSHLALASKQLGVSQTDLLRVTETLNKAVLVGGNTAQEASAGLIQLSQSIAFGGLQGDELLSELENLTGVSDALVVGLNQIGTFGEVAHGDIHRLVSEGQLTADVFLQAFLAAGDDVDSKFSEVSVTIGQGVQQLENSLLNALGRLDDAVGFSARISSNLSDAARTLDEFVRALDGIDRAETDRVLQERGVGPGAIEAIRANAANPANSGSSLIRGFATQTNLAVQRRARPALEAAYRELTGPDGPDPSRLNFDELEILVRRREAARKNAVRVDREATLADPFGGRVSAETSAGRQVGRGVGALSISRNDPAYRANQARLNAEAARLGERQRRALERELRLEGEITEEREKQLRDDLEYGTLVRLPDRSRAELEALIQRGAAARKLRLEQEADEKNALQAAEERRRQEEKLAAQRRREEQQRATAVAALDSANDRTSRALDAPETEYEQEIATARRFRDEQLAAATSADEAGLDSSSLRSRTQEVYQQQLADAAEAERLRSSGVARALENYARESADTASQIENALGNAFRGAKQALTDFVTRGKLDFKSLASSIARDLIRIQIQSRITGPIAAAAGNFFSNLFSAGNANGGGAFAGRGAGVNAANAVPGLAGVAHTGGRIEAVSRRRRVPALTFASAPRPQEGTYTADEAGLDSSSLRSRTQGVYQQQLADAAEAERLRSSGVARALENYARESADTASQIENALGNAFRGAKQALTDFVTRGKLDFKSFASSIVRDLIRIQIQSRITGPIAAAAGNFFSNLFSAGNANGGGAFAGRGAGVNAANAVPGLAGVAHTGGRIEAVSRRRRVPALTFAGAPRPQEGAYLAPDEIPAILQRGETVIPAGGADTLPDTIATAVRDAIAPVAAMLADRPATLPAASRLSVEIRNEGGGELEVTEAMALPDPNGQVIAIVLDDIASNGPISRGLQGAFGRRQDFA